MKKSKPNKGNRLKRFLNNAKYAVKNPLTYAWIALFIVLAIATVIVDKPAEPEKVEPEKKSLFGRKTDRIAAEIKEKDAAPAENAETESGTTKDE